MEKADINLVGSLINRLKAALDDFNEDYQFIFKDSRKSREFFINYAVCRSDIKEVMGAFTVANYCGGPEPDDQD